MDAHELVRFLVIFQEENPINQPAGFTMKPPASFRPAAPLAPMPLLFARYVTGQIADPFWDQFMQVLDANETPPAERLALAAFLNDAFFDLGPDTIKMPQSKEMKELLAEVVMPSSTAH